MNSYTLRQIAQNILDSGDDDEVFDYDDLLEKDKLKRKKQSRRFDDDFE
jgi:hypothetical protein